VLLKSDLDVQRTHLGFLKTSKNKKLKRPKSFILSRTDLILFVATKKVLTPFLPLFFNVKYEQGDQIGQFFVNWATFGGSL
jgi:hypothetical protein